MKKKFFIIFILLILCSKSVLAQIKVQKIGSDIVSNNQIISFINVDLIMNNINSSRLYMKPLDCYFVNINNPDYKIPVNKMVFSNNKNIFQMTHNQEILLDDNVQKYNFSYLSKIDSIESLPAGRYSTRIQFENRNMENNEVEIFNLEFDIPVTQSVTSNYKEIQFNLSNSEVFMKKIPIKDKSSPRIIISSNVNWKLYLDTTDFIDAKEEYYVEIVNTSENVRNYINQPVMLNDKKTTLLASGVLTNCNLSKGKNNDYLSVKYFLKNAENDFIEAGIINNQIKYILKEDN